MADEYTPEQQAYRQRGYGVLAGGSQPAQAPSPWQELLSGLSSSFGRLPQAIMEDVRRAPQIGRDAARYVLQNMTGTMMGAAPGELQRGDITPAPDRETMLGLLAKFMELYSTARRQGVRGKAYEEYEKLAGPRAPDPAAPQQMQRIREESTPKIPRGTMRLYRGETAGGESPWAGTQNPEQLALARAMGHGFDPLLPRGRFYSEAPEIARMYSGRVPAGTLKYVDVPQDLAAKYRQGMTTGSMHPQYEYIVPESVHQRRVPVPQMPEQKITPLPWEVGAP